MIAGMFVAGAGDHDSRTVDFAAVTRRLQSHSHLRPLGEGRCTAKLYAILVEDHRVGERDRRVCRASTVTCWNEPVLSILLALIQHHQTNMYCEFVKLAGPNENISLNPSITAAPHVRPAPNTTIKIKSPR